MLLCGTRILKLHVALWDPNSEVEVLVALWFANSDVACRVEGSNFPVYFSMWGTNWVAWWVPNS